MLIKEYRILLPLTVEEYRIAQLYMIQKKSRLESSGMDSGVEIFTNEPYDNGPGGAGQYTFKVYHITNYIPSWIRGVLPTGALSAHEESWNAYPYTKTRYTCPFMERLHVDIETRYFNDFGKQDNVFGLSEAELRNREVDVMDFVNDESVHEPEDDPRQFHSRKTGRGPLTDNWLEECQRLGQPVMCAYKLCRVEFRYWGLQTRAERWIHDLALRKTMLHAHRQAWVWQDEWVGLSMIDIRRLEMEAAHYLSNVMANASSAEEDVNRPKSPSKATMKKRATNRDVPDHRRQHIDSAGETAAGGPGTSEDDDVCLSISRDTRQSKPKSASESGDGDAETKDSADANDDDDDSDSGDVFFDCFDQPNFNAQKRLKQKPALIRWSSELLLEAGEDDEIALTLMPKDHNGALLILVFHGDIFPEYPDDTKTTDSAALQSTLEHIAKSHYPQLKGGRLRVLQVACGQELAPTLRQLTGISAHFNVFHPSFAVLLTSHKQTFEEAIYNTIKSANEVLHNFLHSDAGVNFRNAEIFVVGDYVGGLLMYEAIAKSSLPTTAGTPSIASAKEHRQVSRNFSSISVQLAGHERNPSSCFLYEYNVDEKATGDALFADTIPTPLHKTMTQVLCSENPKSSSRNLSAPPSANFRSLTAFGRLSTSSNDNEANENWAVIPNEFLSFKPNTAFLLGCPLALVLMHRKLAGKEVPELECGQLFNLYYPLDLYAGRLEPVLNSQLATLPPLVVPRYQRNRPALGSGRELFFDSAMETPMLWGSRRVDQELYCPPEMTSLPSSALPGILHASYWESKDVGEFILRQFVRVDNADSPIVLENSAFLNSAKNLLMDCDIPSKLWNRRRTKFKIANLTANHRANDLIIVDGAPAGLDVINARFCYGPMDLVALSLENVLVYVRPVNSKWMLNSKEMTDTHGRVSVRLNSALPVGVHEVRMIVQGDRSYLNLYVAVVPAGTECVVFSIDGSLTGSVSVTGRDPRVKPGAVDVVRYWQQQGHLIIYVTARPDMQQKLVAQWLVQHNFPHGLLYFTPSISTDPLKQKIQLLRQLVEQKLCIHAAYGSAKDVHVYSSVGVESDRIFRVGSSKKRHQDCMVIEDGYAKHLHSINSGEVAIAQPATCGAGAATGASQSATTASVEDSEPSAPSTPQMQSNFLRRNDSFAPRSGKYASFHSSNKKSSQISISTR